MVGLGERVFDFLGNKLCRFGVLKGKLLIRLGKGSKGNRILGEGNNFCKGMEL